jgi:hypothetical protein
MHLLPILALVAAHATEPVPTPANVARRFDYDEHCLVSNDAFKAALNKVEAMRGQAGVDEKRLDSLLALKWMSASKCLENGKDTSYGDLVSLVDLAKSPSDFLLGRWNVSGSGIVSSCHIPWETIRGLEEKTQSFRAMRENEEHFGNRGLVTANTWHLAANASAASGCLPRALMLNAFADHYLEDLLAPGHVRSQRADVYDLFAMGSHDYYNKEGVLFELRSLESLKPMIAWVPESAVLVANNGDGIVQQGGVDTVRFYGDKQLWKSPRQRAIIVLVISRSIAEVMQAYVTHADGGNEVAAMEWQPYQRVGRRRYEAPTIVYPFGRMRRDTVTTIRTQRRSPLLSLSVTQLNYLLDSGVTLPARVPRAIPALDATAVWAISQVHPQYVDEDGRPRGRLQPNHGFLIGANATASRRSLGFGPSMMALTPISLLNLQFATEFYGRYYPITEFDNPVGVGAKFLFQFGFGFVHLGFQAGYEFVDVSEPTIVRTNYGTILTLIIPRRQFDLRK